MNISNKLSDITTKLENSLLYDDWKLVQECVDELNYLYEDMESSFPMENFDEDEY
jgi:hypothetical protein